MGYGDGKVREGFNVDDLFKTIEDATKAVKDQLDKVKGKGESISIAEMFETQMIMNHLSQLAEMHTGVMSACNSAMSSMARNVKS